MDELVPGIDFAALAQMSDTTGKAIGVGMLALLPVEDLLRDQRSAVGAAVGQTKHLASPAPALQLSEQGLLKERSQTGHERSFLIPGKDANGNTSRGVLV